MLPMRAATFTVFPRGFPLVTPIVIRARGEGKTTRGIYARRRGSLFIDESASGSAGFAPAARLMGKTAATACRMGTTESIFAIGQMKENRGIASLNFSQAFTARKEAKGAGGPRNITDFFMCARINII